MVLIAKKYSTRLNHQRTPTQIYLRGEVKWVFLYPQSQFYFYIEDYNRSFVLQPFPEGIWFPARAAIFDSFIEVHSDPLSGRDLRVLQNLLSWWSSALFKGGQRVVFGSDLLDSECLGIMESLRPENRPYFEAMVRHGISLMGFPILDHIVRRYSIGLGALFFPITLLCARFITVLWSHHEEARRPLPLPFADRFQPDIYEYVPAASRPQIHEGKSVFPILSTMSRPIQKYLTPNLMLSIYLTPIFFCRHSYSTLEPTTRSSGPNVFLVGRAKLEMNDHNSMWDKGSRSGWGEWISGWKDEQRQSKKVFILSVSVKWSFRYSPREVERADNRAREGLTWRLMAGRGSRTASSIKRSAPFGLIDTSVRTTTNFTNFRTCTLDIELPIPFIFSGRTWCKE